MHKNKNRRRGCPDGGLVQCLLYYFKESKDRKHDTYKAVDINKSSDDTYKDSNNGNTCKNTDKYTENSTYNNINDDVDDELCNVGRLKCQTPNLF